MGNAMDFLNDKDNRDKYRRGQHGRECREKQEKFLETNKPTVLEECSLIKKGPSHSHKVNEKHIYEKSLPGIHSRNFHKRAKEPCSICGTEYIPSVRKRESTIHEKKLRPDGMTAWCHKCEQKDFKYRLVVKEIGLERYEYLLTRDPHINTVRKFKTLYQVSAARAIKTELHRATEAVEISERRLIKEAYKINEEKLNHPEFDF